MSLLRIYPDQNDPSRFEEISDFSAIAEAAHSLGLRLERWKTPELKGSESAEEILALYGDEIEGIKADLGFGSADIIALSPEAPNKEELRKKFLAEHIHADDEARFFIHGRGLFCIHAGDSVYALTAEAGDMINVPKNTKHWFDTGAAPDFSCIRFFTTPEGWVAEYTGSDIAKRFPSLD